MSRSIARASRLATLLNTGMFAFRELRRRLNGHPVETVFIKSSRRLPHHRPLRSRKCNGRIELNPASRAINRC